MNTIYPFLGLSGRHILAVTFFGECVAYVANDGVLRIWNDPSHSYHGSFSVFSEEEFNAVSWEGEDACCLLEPCETYLATALPNQDVIKVWDPKSATCVKELRNPGKLQQICYRDGLIASISFQGSLAMWQLATEGLLWTQEVGKLECPAVFSGQQLAIACNEGIQIFDAATGNCLYTLATEQMKVVSMGFGSCLNSLTALLSDNLVRTWNLPSLGTSDAWIDIQDLALRSPPIFVPGSSNFIAVSGKEAISVIEFSSNTKSEKPGSNNATTLIKFSPDGSVAATLSITGLVRLWNSKTGQVILDFKVQHGDSAIQVELSPDNSKLVCTTQEGVGAWDLLEGSQLWAVQDKMSWACHRVLCGHGSKIISCLASRTIEVRDLFSGNCEKNITLVEGDDAVVRKTIRSQRKFVCDLETSYDGTLAASFFSNHTAEVWDLDTERRVLSINEEVGEIAFQTTIPTTKLAYVLMGSNTIHIWDKTSGAHIFEFPLEEQHNLHAMSFGKSWIAIAADDNTTIWDARSGQCLERIQGRSSGPEWVAGDDSRLLFTNSNMLVLKARSDENKRFVQRVVGIGLNYLISNHGPDPFDGRGVWIPCEYRNQVTAISEDTIALSSVSGHIVFLPLL